MIVGIDLGTTNSAIGVWRDGRAQLIPNSLGSVLTPSCVGVDESGAVLVGMPARDRQTTHPALTASAFKRYMGTRRSTMVGRQSFLPEELSSLVLKSLKADAEAFLGEPVTEAIITVPAYFNDKQRKATRRAGELAGLTVERLLNEPTAAALAYGIDQLGDETRFLVFDLGGGTFDVSILEIFEGVIEVRASTGDNRLGGEDFNEVLASAMRARFTRDWGTDGSDDPLLHQRIRIAAERARRALTDRQTATMELVWRERAYSLDVTEADFESRAASLLERLREPVVRSLRDSDLRADMLREIVLVGGATRMPIVRRLVARMFGRFPATAVNPDEAVALGAAIQAGLKMRDAALKEVAVTDVCPYTLGIEVVDRLPNGTIAGGRFAPIIERNIVVPASRVKRFSTVQANQRVVTVEIYQGESRKVADNIHLGTLKIPVPPKKAGEVDLDCRFSYDINGLIEVDVHVPLTDERRQLVIVDEDGPSEEEIEKRRAILAALKQHPRDSDAHRAALARANRCYEDFLGDKRELVSSYIAQYELALETQDLRVAERARRELIEQLDALEGQTYL
jgi:molecular chaperone HscC